MTVLYFVSIIIVSYLVGSVNNALILAYFKKVDLRRFGSGNPGTMNVTRTMGQRWGWFVLFLDIIKGGVPCLLGWWLLGGTAGFDYTAKSGFLGFWQEDKLGIYVAGVSVIVGHIFPLYYGFRGGKGIASTIGILLVASPLVTVICFLIGLAFIKITNVGSITSFIVIGIPIAFEGFVARLYWGNTVEPILLFCLFAMTLIAHNKNIVKLFKYTEKPVVNKRKTR